MGTERKGKRKAKSKANKKTVSSSITKKENTENEKGFPCGVSLGFPLGVTERRFRGKVFGDKLQEQAIGDKFGENLKCLWAHLCPYNGA